MCHFPLPSSFLQAGMETCDREDEVSLHASPLQNGGLVRRGSITSFKSGGGVRENGGVPCRDRRGSGGGGSCGGGGGGAGGESPYHHHPHHHHLHPHPHPHHHHHNPEACSLTSIPYDVSPGLPTSASTSILPQQEQRKDSDAATPGDDQVSLASFHSSHSRTYSQGYIRPLPPPGCSHYSLHPCQSRPCPQSEPQSLPPSSIQQGQSYASLNPSSLYSLSSEYYEARCGQSSFSAGEDLLLCVRKGGKRCKDDRERGREVGIWIE